MSAPEPQGRPSPTSQTDGSYPSYVLGVLVLVYIFNFLDRQILSILNDEIKRDLGLNDAQMGFLYGTAFAVFYAIFGIPLGRLADVWNRRSLISIGLAFWSLMTAVSGLARNFLQIGAARIGVGVGESSATPAAFSLLSDYFRPERRATVLAVYSSGIYIGAGLGLMIGGQVVDRWDAAFAPGEAPFGLRGWQAAFFAVGLPGLLLSIWVATLREPVRGLAEGLATPPHPHPFRAFFQELRAVIPPFTIFYLLEIGGGARAVVWNLATAALLAVAAIGLIQLTGDVAQWGALAIGLYAAASWMQGLGLRDAPASALIFRTPSLSYGCVGFAFLAFTGYGTGYWTPIFFVRQHQVDLGEVGLVLGLTAAGGGWAGVTLGGVLADRLRAQRPNGRLLVGALTAIMPLPFLVWLLLTPSTTTGFVLSFFTSLFTATWLGAGASTVQDLVLPRMRASASAFYLLVVTFIGLALGPYTVGKLSDALGLRDAMLLALLANGLAFLFLSLAMRSLARDERTLRARAADAGEAIDAGVA